MLTPMDIHNREFKKGLRGYKEKVKLMNFLTESLSTTKNLCAITKSSKNSCESPIKN